MSELKPRRNGWSHQRSRSVATTQDLLNSSSGEEFGNGHTYFGNGNMMTNDLIRKSQEAQDLILNRYNDEMKKLISNVVKTAANSQLYTSDIPDNIHYNQHQHSGEVKGIRSKQFTPRHSVLTELFYSSTHIRTVYNIFVAILILFSIQTVICDLLETGRVQIDFELITWGCGRFPIVTSIWLGMMAATLIVYPVFSFWSRQRIQNRAVYDGIALITYISYMMMFFTLPIKYVVEEDMPPISTVIVVLEQIRLMMKVHSFVRENIPAVLDYKKRDDKKTKLTVDFSKYLYFLFAPTLIYREEYPRTENINWSFAMSNMFQVVICIFYTYYIFIRFCVPNFSKFSKDHVTLQAFTMSLFGCMMPATLMLLIAFFAILHSWLNAWAEMMRFADRLFYKDWWNTTSFSGYYRTWNVVVHDWLYTYIYQDIYKLTGFNRNLRGLVMYLTFFISAVVHEYVLTIALKFFYPVLFLQFAGFGVLLMYFTAWTSRYHRSSNIIIWVLLFVGMGGLMCSLSMEWYARVNCLRTVDSFSDYLVPRSWYCERTSDN